MYCSISRNIPIAVIEAKDNNHAIGAGMQQGLNYAELLQVPFIFSLNDDGFLFHNKIAADGLVERELGLHEFPSADMLWQQWLMHKGIHTHGRQHALITQDYYSNGSNKTPLYYRCLPSIAPSRRLRRASSVFCWS